MTYFGYFYNIMEQTKHGTPQTFVQVLSFALTVAAHPHLEALLQAAVLASVAMVLCHLTGLGVTTSVPKLLPNASFEKAFAAFTAYGTVVSSCSRQKWYLN